MSYLSCHIRLPGALDSLNNKGLICKLLRQVFVAQASLCMHNYTVQVYNMRIVHPSIIVNNYYWKYVYLQWGKEIIFSTPISVFSFV